MTQLLKYKYPRSFPALRVLCCPGKPSAYPWPFWFPDPPAPYQAPTPLPRGWGRLAGCSGRAPYLHTCFGHEDFPVPERENFPVENVCVSNPYWSPHTSPLIPTSLIPGLPSSRTKKEGGTSGSGFRFPLWSEYLNPPRTPPKKSGSESWTNIQESSFVHVPLGTFIEDDMLPFLQGYSMYIVFLVCAQLLLGLLRIYTVLSKWRKQSWLTH
jgi:hypothetical protein